MCGAIFLETNPTSYSHHALFQPLVPHSCSAKNPAPLTTCTIDTILLSANQHFLTAHRLSVQTVGQDIDMILVYKGDELSLWRKQAESWQSVAKTIPTSDVRYTRLKQIAHIHVLVAMLLDVCCISAEQASLSMHELQHMLLPKINLLLEENSLKQLYPEDAAMQTLILQESRNCINALCQLSLPFRQCVLIEIKRRYVNILKAAVWYSNSKATEVQLSNLHTLVKHWQDSYQLEAARSRVIIVSPHGPRIGRIEAQFFTRWYEDALGSTNIEDNMLYSIESLPEKFAELDVKRDLIESFLMGSELNKGIGETILGNRKKMFSDILESHAEPALRRLFLGQAS